MRPDTAAVTQSKPLRMFKEFYFDALTHHPRAILHWIDLAMRKCASRFAGVISPGIGNGIERTFEEARDE